MDPMLDYPAALRDLVGRLRRMPGLGPRSAERLGVWMLQEGREESALLGQCIGRTLESVGYCEECGFFQEQGRCALCADTRRDQKILCVVEKATEILPIERTSAYRGMYHVLGGHLSPLDNIGPEHLRMEGLRRRVIGNAVAEIVIALGSDVEGDATAHFLGDYLADLPVRLTRLAQGMPVGGGLESADALTLQRAFSGRQPM